MKETPLFRFITAGFLSFLKSFLKFRFPKNLTNIQIAPITTAIPILYKNTLPYPPILGSKNGYGYQFTIGPRIKLYTT